MDFSPNVTPDEELDTWERLAKKDDCISNGRFVEEDIQAMCRRIRKAEAALAEIAGARALGSDSVSRAQTEALISIARRRLPEVQESKQVADAVAEVYEGAIAPGMRFVWEPAMAHARCLVEVRRVLRRRDGNDNWICAAKVGSSDDPSWNEESRFREAVIPVTGTVAAN